MFVKITELNGMFIINSRAVCALLGMSQVTSMARHYHRLVNLTQTLENKYS